MDNEIALARHLIQNAGLSYPDLPLVERFICDAKDNNEAARYMLKVCEDDKTGTKFLKFVEDWKCLVRLFFSKDPRPASLGRIAKKAIVLRDNNRCCITGTRSRIWNNCGVFPILPLHTFSLRERRDEPIYDLLGSFISPIQRDMLLSDEDEFAEDTTRNYWVLSKEMAKSFSRGELSLQDVGANKEGNAEDSAQKYWVLRKDVADSFSAGEPSLQGLGTNKYNIRYNNIGGDYPAFYTMKRMASWESNLTDHSKSGIASPDPVLLEIHHRFSIALTWTHIAANMRSPQQNYTTTNTTIKDAIVTTSLAIWLKFPRVIRFQTYSLLKTVGEYLYGGSNSMWAQRLPFGMYLKSGPIGHLDRHAREFEALNIVRSRVSIPVPRPVDLIASSTHSFLVTSRIEGDPVGINLHTYSDEAINGLAEKLNAWITELRTIERPTGFLNISSASGGSLLDYRIISNRAGPFKNEQDFSEHLRLGALPNLVHSHDHEIVFTHADLNMSNILAKDGVLTGIIDWENAGWYPDYWEYTKCHFGVILSKRWMKVIDMAFDHKYQEELQIERQYWLYNEGF